MRPSAGMHQIGGRKPLPAGDLRRAFVKRGVDVVLSSVGLVVSAPVIIVAALAIALTSRGSPIFPQARVGCNERPFTCYKLRTMRLGTPNLATHEVTGSAITPVGAFLRRTKLDELPQLWNVLVGDMSLVGPRPCLPQQTELIRHRRAYGVSALRPGITGIAQINAVDMSEPERLACLDSSYLTTQSLCEDLRILRLTLIGRGSGDRVRENTVRH